MSKRLIITKRAHPLSKEQQEEFLTHHIPGRIRSIKKGLGSKTLNYIQLAGVAMLARSVAGFLGLGTSGGCLCEKHDYFAHKLGQSWEVKLSDVNGGACLKLSALLSTERTIVEDGINETNTAFAHLTFWNDPANQDTRGKAKEEYARKQVERIRKFAETVIELYEKHTKGLPTA
jgi:hypothetical protein